MSFVFISHSSQDKQRIAPHLLFRIPFLYPVQPDRPGEPSLKDRALLYGADCYFDAYDRY